MRNFALRKLPWKARIYMYDKGAQQRSIRAQKIRSFTAQGWVFHPGPPAMWTLDEMDSYERPKTQLPGSFQ